MKTYHICLLCLLFLLNISCKTLLVTDNSLLSFNITLNSRKITRINNITIPQDIYDLTGDYILQLSSKQSTRIPVCLLKRARYQYTLNVIWDQDEIIKVDLAVPATDCLKEIRPRSAKFKITVRPLHKEIGKRPLLLEWKEKEEIKDGNQSFFIKYWYIIVPLALFLFMPVPGEKV